MNAIRNFSIIAHIDHGKSTLADRLLELTATVEKRKMQEQLLDQMDLERERGITIKMAPVRMRYTKDGKEYLLNLIDTPGHVDFGYEVSRSLAAVEGALLIVDATQGIEAQTLANLYLALEEDLAIIPVLNKIDLPNANPEGVGKEVANLIGCDLADILRISAKTGEGVAALLDAIVDRVPAPTGDTNAQPRALVFDSYYDDYRGVVASVRVVDGGFRARDTLYMMATNVNEDIGEVGHFSPKLAKDDVLTAGQIGYVVTNLKDVASCRVGDTMTVKGASVVSLGGYKEVKPMVYAGLFCKEGDDYAALRKALEELALSDASLVYEAVHSKALGYGFRCGFLGLLHLDIIQERLRREYGLDLFVTVPSVSYYVYLTSGEKIIVSSPYDLPDPSRRERVEEPWMTLDVITPTDYLGGMMEFVTRKYGEYKNTEYLDEKRVILHFAIPLSQLLTDFYDQLKSISQGYASMNYDFIDYRPADVVKLDILVAEDAVEALASIVYRDEAFSVGKQIVAKLKETIPKQQFVIKLQAAVGGHVLAAERLSALRKDVTAKLYGGDVTRKRKLLEKQKKGKKRMMAMGTGKVDIPQEAFLAVLKRD